MKLKKGDLVQVISGRDKGKQGTIVQIMPLLGKVVIEGINVVKRHVKPTQTSPQGGITEKALPLFASKVMIVDPKTGKPTRIKLERKSKGKKGGATQVVRIAKKSGAELGVLKKA
jgi:large subunit ribosomal protein L24